MPVGGGRQHKNEEGSGRSHPCVPILFIEGMMCRRKQRISTDGRGRKRGKIPGCSAPVIEIDSY